MASNGRESVEGCGGGERREKHRTGEMMKRGRLERGGSKGVDKEEVKERGMSREVKDKRKFRG